MTRSTFSLALPPQWRLVDPKSPNLETDYRSLTSENPDFGKGYPLEALRQVTAPELLAFDFTPRRSSPTFFTALIVTSEGLGPWEKDQSLLFRIYAYQVRGATNVTNQKARVGNVEGKRVTLEYPMKTSDGDATLRETWFLAYPDRGGVVVLTFVSRAELADAYESEFQSIADRFELAK